MQFVRTAVVCFIAAILFMSTLEIVSQLSKISWTLASIERLLEAHKNVGN